jgi:7,8-dihydro-6-hydroxymethylpterin-pyrophosphokinase
LGSNLGNRPAHLAAGLAGLRELGLSVGPVSSLYLTEPDLRPAGLAHAPDAQGNRHEIGRSAVSRDRADWRRTARQLTSASRSNHPWYVNCVAAIDGAPAARELLRMCLEIERRHGRSRSAERAVGVASASAPPSKMEQPQPARVDAGAGGSPASDKGETTRADRDGPRPRTLDLDILLIGAEVIDEPGLQVPHLRLESRRFVLEPLAEIAAGVRHPTAGATIGELLERLPAGEGVWLLAPPPEADG